METQFLTRVWLKNDQNLTQSFSFVANKKKKKFLSYMYMNKLLILTSYAKFELNSLRNNEITMKLLITDILAVATKWKS